MKSIFHILIVSILFFGGCKPEDSIIDPQLDDVINSGDPYALNLGDTHMGDDYRYQVFFDLGTNSSVSSNLKSSWDICLSSRGEDKVYLNSAKTDLRCAPFDGDFNDVPDLDALTFDWDVANWHEDSVVIGSVTDQVYIVNRGLDYLGAEMGYKKIQIQSTSNGYIVKSSDLNNDNYLETELTKDESYNFLFFNLDGYLSEVEPPTADWDIYFSHYLYVYFPEVDPFPYMVTGCLVNSNQVQVARVFDKPYDEINYSDVLTYQFTDERNHIGFDWKYFDFELGFVANEDMNFLIQSQEGDYYKLHFTSFYDENGEKGNPQFEFHRLKEE